MLLLRFTMAYLLTLRVQGFDMHAGPTPILHSVNTTNFEVGLPFEAYIRSNFNLCFFFVRRCEELSCLFLISARAAQPLDIRYAMIWQIYVN